MRISPESGDSSSVSHEQVTTAYLDAFRLIDKRVTPYLGKATTRVLVQAAAKRLAKAHPCLAFLERTPYTEVAPSMLNEQCHASVQELNAGLHALLQECFLGIKELTGNLIEPLLHEEVSRQLGKMS